MDEKQLLQGRFRDLSDRAFRQGYMTHTAFLSASEQAVFYDYVRTREGHPDSPRLGGAEYLLYGGREDADRRAAVFLPAWMDRKGSWRQRPRTRRWLPACGSPRSTPGSPTS